MNDRTHEQLGAVLTAIDEITPEPPPLPAAPMHRPVNRRPLPVAVGAFSLVLVVIGMAALAMRSPVDESGDAASGASSNQAVPLPRFTLDLPDWSIDGINNTDLSTAVIFSKDSTEASRELAVIVVSSDGPDDPPGTRYAAAVASNLHAEDLGTVSIDDGFTVQGFRFGGDDPNYEFLWQNTESVMVQIVVMGVGYDEATEIVAALTPITQEHWTDLVAQFPQTEMATTTMPPGAPPIREPETVDITTTTMP
jgi:hypothetical protein